MPPEWKSSAVTIGSAKHSGGFFYENHFYYLRNMIEYQPKCISEGNYRFALEQPGKHVLIVIGVNPSTADESKPDPTMQSVLRFVNAFGYDGFVMLNLSSERCTNPLKLATAIDMDMHKRNLEVIKEMSEKYPQADILLAYGNNIERRMYLGECFSAIYPILQSHKRWLCIGGKECMTKYGHPRHPLYASTKLGLQELDMHEYTHNHYYHWRGDFKHYQFPEDESEWRWCIVGNIIGAHPYGVEKEIRYGTKHFVAGAKVYCVIAHNDPDKLVVLGCPRHSRKFIEVIIPRSKVENLRLQKCYKPAVLDIMKQRHWAWYGNTDADKEEAQRILSILSE